MKTVLLVAKTTGYQVREFSRAAADLGIRLQLATDRCKHLEDPWQDQAIPLDFSAPLLDRSLIPDGIVAVGDPAAVAAAHLAETHRLRFHRPSACRAAVNKFLTRQRFAQAGLFTPRFAVINGIGQPPSLPCVIKPLQGSASTGVIRVDTVSDYERHARAALSRTDSFLAEEYVPGTEYALEGLVRDGILSVVTIFAKPDPLTGPYFEESIYLTHAHVPEAAQEIQRGVTAIGLAEGPIHAEFRVTPDGIFILEIAPRPIGGLCSRVLRFAGGSNYEHVLLRACLGESPDLNLSGPSGVMMIPVPAAGVLQETAGLNDALREPFIEDIVITAKPGSRLIPWPEGNSYPGFIFARGADPAALEASLRAAHAKLDFRLLPSLPILPQEIANVP
jgi:hypothetical protein